MAVTLTMPATSVVYLHSDISTSFELAAGVREQLWWRIHDNPETPVLAGGIIAVV